ncbi:acetyltransferase (GNAT) family protein [Kribbella voronezhensis]|uniref:Acetyltransferase (GNAT) family protein n=1 Tax=Kribbella voronezhensis TaxID=2512212 RepID=A0A4R7TCN6_9ACTN|nr:GNAT family N-acetyltransferase [Kribbella voronezhensis]TDU89795.1 acetyltransferase (GNAT) family protein [Kribbella voronezhensis]
MPEIRPYRVDDRPAVGDICVRTADNGGDSRSRFPDLELMPSIFAFPYVELEPELAFVLDDGERAVGYILGCADTPAFARRFRAEWLPRVPQYGPLTGPARTPAEEMIGLLHDPERLVIPEVADYPAHLHIDLLPAYQGAGYGRALMNRFLTTLADRGVPAVHLTMLTSNTPARAFYDRLGFHHIPVPGVDVVTYLGRSTS